MPNNPERPVSGLPDDPAKLERELVKRMQAAARVYREAVADHEQVLNKHLDMLDHPDGAHAWRNAAASERLALEKYAAAIKDYSNMMLRKRAPKA
jgi:flagellar motor switch protein FliG